MERTIFTNPAAIFCWILKGGFYSRTAVRILRTGLRHRDCCRLSMSWQAQREKHKAESDVANASSLLKVDAASDPQIRFRNSKHQAEN